MTPCWQEGDLRAYVDGELPLETQQDLSAHLDACAECGARYRELSARAVRVANLMAMLPELAPADPATGGHRRRWAMAALALAAAAAIGFVMLPKRGREPAPAFQDRVPVTVASVTVEPPAEVWHPVRNRTARPNPAPHADYFLRLDDEPIETGTLVRVGAENGDVQAELILGPDGRAHAIRVISNQ